MKTSFLTLALALSAATAVAQQVPMSVDPRTVPELKAEFARAAKLGLPEAPLVSRARLGYSYNASVKRIGDVMHALTDRMVMARNALTPVQADAELEAGANAIQSGVPERVLRNLRTAQPVRSLAVPIGVLQELVLRGVPWKQAAVKVDSMLKRNVADVQIALLGRDIQADIASGLAPSVALDVRSRGVLSLPQGAVQGSAVAPTTIRPPPR